MNPTLKATAQWFDDSGFAGIAEELTHTRLDADLLRCLRLDLDACKRTDDNYCPTVYADAHARLDALNPTT
jgi:hypothetical protein